MPNLYRVKLVDPAIARRALVTIFIVVAKNRADAEAIARRENESAFSLQPAVGVRRVKSHSVKQASYSVSGKDIERVKEAL